jgi:hypothetical protein
LLLLISLTGKELYAQNRDLDTLKKPITDTIPLNDEQESIEEQIKYTAQDSAVAMPEMGKAFLYGKSKIEYGSMNLEAEFIEIDYNKNVVTAYGKKDSTGKNVCTPVFKEGDETMEADKIMYNLKTKKGKIFNALTKQGDLLVIGNEIKKDSTNIIYMKNMKCIPCQEADARTAFKATKAKIIPNDKIVTGPMYLEIGGIPTPLGLPFGFFPNTKKQHNGILLPTFGNSTTQGLNLRQGGYYWGINDMTEMIIRGDIYANGSWALNTTNNYKVLYKSTGSTYLSYSQFNIGDKDIPSSYSKRKAFEVRWTHTQDNRNNPTTRFSANVNFIKNQNVNRLRSDNSQQFLQSTFQSNIIFSKTFKLSSLSINASHSQNSQTGQMTLTFPQLTYNINRFNPFKRKDAVKENVFDKIGVSYLLQISNSLSGKDSTIFKGSIADSMKYGVLQSIPISTNFNLFKFITVSPGLNLTSYSYLKGIEKSYYLDTTIVKTKEGASKKVYVPRQKTAITDEFITGYDANFTTAFTTKVFFDYLFNKGKINQIRHLLIPTLGYTYRPDYGASKFGFYKPIQTDSAGTIGSYSIFERGVFGGPTKGKENSLSINLNNNLEAKLKQRTDTGVNYKKVVLLQNVSLSTKYNFAADSLKMSNLILTGRTVVFKNININMSSGFNPYVYSQQTKTVVNRYLINEGKGAARFTNATISVNTALSSNMVEAAKKLRQPPSVNNGAEKGAEQDLNNSPGQAWNIGINYNLILTNTDARKTQPSHQLGLTADFMPTKFWKVGVTSGYDFTNQKLSYTNISLHRDLKCWEADINWIPFGVNKSYRLTINLKTALLNEFKIPRQSLPVDNF